MSREGSRGGTGIATVLFLIFLVLKLAGVITWSWWWVFSPIWSVFLLLLIFVGVYLLMKKSS